MVRRYAEYGLSRLAIIFHDWQRCGYDQGLPDHHPANPALGTGEEMAAFVAEARRAGMLVALHENYTDMYPDNRPDYPSPLCDESAIARDPQGRFKLGWYHPFTQQQAFVIGAHRMIDFSRLESADVARDYAPNAAYLDVSTGWSPGRAIDHDAAHGAPPTLAFAFAEHLALFHSIRDQYGGPLLGEGGEGAGRFDSFFAGAVDAVERQTERRRFARVIPDFEILCVRPLMLNHGMGYYSRYFVSYGQTTPDVAEVDLDQYRASEIAFAHAGFLGDSIGGVADWMSLHAPEYWLLQALQTRYGGAPYLGASVESQGSFISLGQALRDELDLARARLRLQYQDLTVFINRDHGDFRASGLADFSWRQGEGGWEYLEDAGAGLRPLAWDPVEARWRGARPFSILGSAYAHPDGGAVVRQWNVPADAAIEVRVSVEDLDRSCGDGVRARLLHNQVEAWSCDLPGDVARACPAGMVSLAAGAGDTLALRIEQKADNYCDSTSYEFEVRYSDGQSHDWTVQTGAGELVLPPSGFWAESESGDFRAGTIRFGGALGTIVDLVQSGGYDYARSRDGRFRTLGALACDGAVARVSGAFGRDLHGQALTRAEAGALRVLELSRRSDLNLRFFDRQRAVIIARGIEGADTVDVRWGDLPDAWRRALDSGAARLRRAPCDFAGNAQEPEADIARDLSGAVLLPGLVEGQHYLIRLVSACGDGVCEVAAGEDCQTCPQDCPTSAGQVCCAGEVFFGDCCADSDCGAGRSCADHRCQGGSDGGEDGTDAHDGDGGGMDAGRDAGDQGLDGDVDGGDNGNGDRPGADSGCGCQMATPASWLAGMLGLLAAIRRKQLSLFC